MNWTPAMLSQNPWYFFFQQRVLLGGKGRQKSCTLYSGIAQIAVAPPTVPQEGHNFVTSGFDFFHFFSLLEGIILMFWGEIGFRTQFTRIHRNFKKNVSKKWGNQSIFPNGSKTWFFVFNIWNMKSIYASTSRSKKKRQKNK